MPGSIGRGEVALAHPRLPPALRRQARRCRRGRPPASTIVDIEGGRGATYEGPASPSKVRPFVVSVWDARAKEDDRSISLCAGPCQRHPWRSGRHGSSSAPRSAVSPAGPGPAWLSCRVPAGGNQPLPGLRANALVCGPGVGRMLLLRNRASLRSGPATAGGAVPVVQRAPGAERASSRAA